MNLPKPIKGRGFRAGGWLSYPDVGRRSGNSARSASLTLFCRAEKVLAIRDGGRVEGAEEIRCELIMGVRW